MAMFDKLLDNLKASRKTIVFTEGTDARILDAAAKLLAEDLMGVILCGNADDVKAAAKAGKAAGEAVDKGSKALGKQLGKTKGMFSSFMDEFKKAQE